MDDGKTAIAEFLQLQWLSNIFFNVEVLQLRNCFLQVAELRNCDNNKKVVHANF
jgi:hypothetical protein